MQIESLNFSFSHGGFLWFPLAVMILSVIIIFICRMVAISRAFKYDHSFMKRIRDYIIEGDTENAIQLCKNTTSPLGITILRGVELIGRQTSEISAMMEKSIKLALSKSRRGIIWLKFMAWGASLIGLCGFSIGLSELSFIDNASMAQTYSQCVSQSWITLASGFAISFISLIALTLLMSRINSLSILLQSKMLEFIDLLNEPS